MPYGPCHDGVFPTMKFHWFSEPDWQTCRTKNKRQNRQDRCPWAQGVFPTDFVVSDMLAQWSIGLKIKEKNLQDRFPNGPCHDQMASFRLWSFRLTDSDMSNKIFLEIKDKIIRTGAQGSKASFRLTFKFQTCRTKNKRKKNLQDRFPTVHAMIFRWRL